MSTEGSGTVGPYKLQAIDTISQAAAVQNTWYTVCNRTGHLKIHQAIVRMYTAAETVEVKFTIDGNTVTGSQAALADTYYYNYLSITLVLVDNITTSVVEFMGTSEALECRSFKMEIRKTTANGANTLAGSVMFERI